MYALLSKQEHKLHSITVMPESNAEMDGQHYERLQRTHSHEPLLPSFPWADRFPVCHLGNHSFQQQASRKTRSDVNSQWIEKEKVKTCRRGTRINSITIRRKKTILSLFCFDKFVSFQLQPVTSKTRPSWNELIFIVHLRTAYQNPVGTLIILADSSQGCQRDFCALLVKQWE